MTHSTRWLGLTALAAATVALLVGCDFKTNEHQGVPPDAVAAFSLLDVNDTSPSGGREVSPRDYFGMVSAWYFGHST